MPPPPLRTPRRRLLSKAPEVIDASAAASSVPAVDREALLPAVHAAEPVASDDAWMSQETFENMAMYNRRRHANSKLTNFVAKHMRVTHSADLAELEAAERKRQVSSCPEP